MTSAWQPRTDEQRAAVKKLARPEVEGSGGLVRSLSDGNDELLIKRNGSVLRYLIAEDGTPQLLSTHPPPPSYHWADTLFGLGIGLFVLGIVLWMTLPGTQTWTFLLSLGGMGTAVLGGQFSPKLKRHTRSGERWQKIGDLSNL